jgi:hypothetical protein
MNAREQEEQEAISQAIYLSLEEEMRRQKALRQKGEEEEKDFNKALAESEALERLRIQRLEQAMSDYQCALLLSMEEHKESEPPQPSAPAVYTGRTFFESRKEHQKRIKHEERVAKAESKKGDRKREKMEIKDISYDDMRNPNDYLTRWMRL